MILSARAHDPLRPPPSTDAAEVAGFDLPVITVPTPLRDEVPAGATIEPSAAPAAAAGSRSTTCASPPGRGRRGTAWRQ